MPGNIFWIVGLALVVSWIVAVFFTPYIGVKLLPNFAKHGAGNDGGGPWLAMIFYDTRIYRALRGAVGWSVRFRWIVIALTLGDLRLGDRRLHAGAAAVLPDLVTAGAVHRDPPAAKARPSTSPRPRRRRPRRFIKGDPDLDYYTTYVGEGIAALFPGAQPRATERELRAHRHDDQGCGGAREAQGPAGYSSSADNVIPEARLRIDRLNFGPPVGFPVQFRVLGPDSTSVREVANKVRDAMRANPNTRDVQFDWNEQKKSIRLEVDQDRARSLGLTPQDIAQTLQTLLLGLHGHRVQGRHRAGTRRGACRAGGASGARLIRGSHHPDALGRGGSHLAGGARSLRVRRADPMAAQPRRSADGALATSLPACRRRM